MQALCNLPVRISDRPGGGKNYLNSFHCKKAKTVILQLACQNLPCRKTHGPVVLPFKGKEFIAALNRYEQHRREKNTKLTPTARRGLYSKLINWKRRIVHTCAESFNRFWVYRRVLAKRIFT